MQILTAQNHRDYINLNVPEAFRPVAFYLLNGCYNNRDKYFDYNRALIEINGKLMWCCTITMKSLAKKIGKSLRMVERAIRFLRDIGLLIIGKKNRKISNQNAYTFECFAATEADMMEIDIRDVNARTESLKSYQEKLEKTGNKLYMAKKSEAAAIDSVNTFLRRTKPDNQPDNQPAIQPAPTRARSIYKSKNKIKNNKAPAAGRVSEATPSGSSDGKAQRAETTRQIADAIGVITNPTGERSENKVAETASVVSCAVGIAASGAKLPEPSGRADIRAKWAELESVGRELHLQSTCTDEELYAFLGDVRRLQASCGGKIPHGLSEIEEFVQFFGRQYDRWVAEKTEPFGAKSENSLETQDMVGVGEGKFPDRAMN